MKKYFYTDGTNNFGPFTLEELKEKNITRETKVWFQELGDWKKAWEVPELNELFKLVPPPPPSSTSEPGYTNFQNQGTKSKPPKNWLVESILVTLFCCLPLGIAGIVNASKVESLFNSGDIEGSMDASKKAEKWTTTGFWIGLVVVVIYLIVVIAGAAGGL
jgi:hypothetical protein